MNGAAGRHLLRGCCCETGTAADAAASDIVLMMLLLLMIVLLLLLLILMLMQMVEMIYSLPICNIILCDISLHPRHPAVLKHHTLAC